MKFQLLLVVGLAHAAPTSTEDGKFVITEKDKFFPDQPVIYTSQYDIVEIFVPRNALNSYIKTVIGQNFSNDDSGGTTLFFVEAEIKEDGTKDYKGLYVLKEGNATKLLENGRAIATTILTGTETKVVYFGASDGIYIYNPEENTAEKYGSVTDSIISICVTEVNGTDVFFILTEDKNMYRVIDNGNKKVKVDEISNAEQIVMDIINSVYYYGADKKPYVVTADGVVKQIDGLPENPTTVTILRPTLFLYNGAIIVIDEKVYVVLSSGVSFSIGIEFRVKQTAYSADLLRFHYCAFNKKIYEIDVMKLFEFNEIPFIKYTQTPYSKGLIKILLNEDIDRLRAREV